MMYEPTEATYEDVITPARRSSPLVQGELFPRAILPDSSVYFLRSFPGFQENLELRRNRDFSGAVRFQVNQV